MGASHSMESAGIVVDLEARRVTREGAYVHLRPKCFRLIATLIDRPGIVFSRDKLLGRVWGQDIYVEPRTVDVHIRRLRQALNAGGGRDLIRTIRASGYSLDSAKT